MTLDETNMEVDDPLFVKDNSIPGGRCPRDILCIISTHCMEKGIKKKKKTCFLSVLSNIIGSDFVLATHVRGTQQRLCSWWLGGT